MHAAPARGTRSRALAFLAGAALAVAAFAVAAFAVAAAGCGPTTPSAAGCKAKLLPGDLVITEVFADFKAVPGGMGGDAGKEWLEIYNAKGEAIDLEGLTITSSRPDGSASNTHGMAAAMIAPGQFFTLGNAERGATPPYIDYGYGGDLGDLFNSGGGKLALLCDDVEIDSAVYDDVREGHARELSAAQPPDYTRNDSPDAWCEAIDSEIETGNFGTPGAANDCAPLAADRCDDGGTMRAVVSPGPGDLVITEVMPSPMRAADATGEWFEAKVMADVDLNGIGLDRAGDNHVAPDVIAGAPCVRVTAGSYVVFARSTDAGLNGGLPAAAIAGLFKFAIVPGTTTPGDVAILAGNTVIDAVRWTRSTGGKALQLDPGRIGTTANDDESNFCDASLPYGPAGSAADLGTPGAANTPCATLPGPGMCDDGLGIRAIVRPIPGQLVISEILANPANVPMGSTDAQREWFEVANLGGVAFDLNELTIGRIGTAGAPVQSARCLPVGPRGFAVLARSADPAANSTLPEVAATFRFGLVDTNGDIQISDGATVLDNVRWTSVTSGVSRQLDPAHMTAVGNDDASHFCASTAPYGDLTNKGTPGAANAPCP